MVRQVSMQTHSRAFSAALIASLCLCGTAQGQSARTTFAVPATLSDGFPLREIREVAAAMEKVLPRGPYETTSDYLQRVRDSLPDNARGFVAFEVETDGRCGTAPILKYDPDKGRLSGSWGANASLPYDGVGQHVTWDNDANGIVVACERRKIGTYEARNVFGVTRTVQEEEHQHWSVFWLWKRRQWLPEELAFKMSPEEAKEIVPSLRYFVVGRLSASSQLPAAPLRDDVRLPTISFPFRIKSTDHTLFLEDVPLLIVDGRDSRGLWRLSQPTKPLP